MSWVWPSRSWRRCRAASTSSESGINGSAVVPVTFTAVESPLTIGVDADEPGEMGEMSFPWQGVAAVLAVAAVAAVAVGRPHGVTCLLAMRVVPRNRANA